MSRIDIREQAVITFAYADDIAMVTQSEQKLQKVIERQNDVGGGA